MSYHNQFYKLNCGVRHCMKIRMASESEALALHIMSIQAVKGHISTPLPCIGTHAQGSSSTGL